ncbi:hypothetical protein BV898_17220 [Hypsibius exemplaris]|uniref:WAP domain-containing protein n=1 Tax=Hypsibius exemplaris TaxID=2072580 RepID=A0A9X6RMD6_HYPEX|nr:hypothetical protein BV898_17220 [Hypsibius exemplaris]
MSSFVWFLSCGLMLLCSLVASQLDTVPSLDGVSFTSVQPGRGSCPASGLAPNGARQCVSDGNCFNGQRCCKLAGNNSVFYCANPVGGPFNGAGQQQKSGRCPAVGLAGGTCARQCNGDFSCRGNLKCCGNGCGTSCRSPVWNYGR